MRIALAFKQDIRKDVPVECYARSFLRVLQEKGHTVTTVGEGHNVPFLGELSQKDFDLLIEIENGRNRKGELLFQQSKANWIIPSVLWAIDPHGQPGIHQHVAPYYKYVFYAPWIKRDLYTDHQNAYWLPNCTDLKWFNRSSFGHIKPQFDFGFHSSRLGLARASKLIEICKKHGWSYDVREVTKAGRQRWPSYSEALRGCFNGYNFSQRQDFPNQRVFETMAMGVPLLCDISSLGDQSIFVPSEDFVGYSRDLSDLEGKMCWMMENKKQTEVIAERAYLKVKQGHLIEHRVDEMLSKIKI